MLGLFMKSDFDEKPLKVESGGHGTLKVKKMTSSLFEHGERALATFKVENMH